LEKHKKGVNVVAISPNLSKTICVSGGNDNIINVYDYNKGEHLLSLTGHEKPINTICFKPDVDKLIILSGTLLIYVKRWR
jgi:WD40 repeat protein